MFFVHMKQTAGVVKFARFEGLFGKRVEKAAPSLRISVDGRSKRRKKAAFS